MKSLIVITLLSSAISIPAQDSLNISLTGRLLHNWMRANDVSVSDGYALLATGSSGLSVVDVNDPENPSEIGFISTVGDAVSIATDGDLAYVVDGSFFNGGLRVVSIGNPDAPQLVGSLSLDNVSGDIFVQGDFAYICNMSYGVFIVYIRDPENPRIVGALNGRGREQITAVQDGLLFIVTGGELLIYDIEDRVNPIQIGSWSGGEYLNSIDVVGNLVYLVDQTSSLYVLDITYRDSIRNIATMELPPYCKTMKVYGTYAYVLSQAELLIIDISVPESLAIVGRISVSGSGNNLAISGSLAFIAESGLWTIDIQDPTNPQGISFYTQGGRAQGVVISDGYAFLANGVNGLRVFNIDEPESPTDLGSFETSARPMSLTVQDTLLFLSAVDSGVRILDISDVDSIKEIGAIPTPKPLGAIGAVMVRDNLAFLAANYGDLFIYDIAEPLNPQFVGAVDDNGDNDRADLALSGNYAYLANGAYGLRIVNISDPSHPVALNNPDFNRDDKVFYVDCQGDLMLLARSTGLQFLDISNPENPNLINTIDSEWGGNITIDGDIAMTVGERLTVLNISDPANPVILGYHATPFEAYGAARMGNIVYVAETVFLSIFDISAALSVPPISANSQQPSAISLIAYPNPFNSLCAIRFSLPTAGFVNLELFDASGRRMMDLVPSQWLPGGEHSVNWDASGLPTGTYLLRVRAEDGEMARLAVKTK
jgi:hypothetical protein